MKLYIIISYYQYSVGDGFLDVEGYDLFDSSKGLDLNVEKKSVHNSAFLVHASKAPFPSLGKDVYPFIDMSMKGTRNMDAVDKKFVVNISLKSSSPRKLQITNILIYSYLGMVSFSVGDQAQLYFARFQRGRNHI